MRTINVSDFRRLYEREIEFAVIDPREELLYSRAHLFGATNMPLSRLELLIEAAVPQRSTMIVLCDDGEGHSERAAGVLSQLGYQDLHVLDGGLPAWALSGGAVFAGMNVPSKAFGEVVERDLQTPTISVTELRKKMEAHEDFLLLDARPESEHFDYCIPGSVSCPSTEMIYRVPELNVDKDKLVVVHCAGRTRSIVGAQTLIDSGLFNNVVSLHNGTLAWQFEGFATEDGNRNVLPAPANRSAEAANRSARNIRETWAIPSLSPQELDSWRRQDGTRYVFDVRTQAEFARGHIPGARHVPGGQLLQTTDRHIAVQNSHIALVDSDGVRAVTAAMWLSRMGWEKVVTCTIPTESLGLATGLQLAHEPSPLVKISIEKAATQLASETAIVCDVRSSVAYRRGHVARAGYLSRAEPERDFPRIPASREILLMAEDLAYASLVGRDLIAFGRAVRLIDGDLAAWTAAGHPTAQGAEWLISRPIDTYFEGDHFEEPQIRDRENRAYLNWEIALIDHIVGDQAVRYAIHKS